MGDEIDLKFASQFNNNVKTSVFLEVSGYYTHIRNFNTVPEFKEQRADPRTEDHSVLELKILFASETPGLLGKNISGSTVDISASGLGLVLDCKVPVNSNLDVRVTLKGEFKKYFLSGKIRWCKESDVAGMFAVGVSLHERTDVATDLDSWKEEFDS